MGYAVAGAPGEARRGLPAAGRRQGEDLCDEGKAALLSWPPLPAEFALGAGGGNPGGKDVECTLHFEGREGAGKASLTADPDKRFREFERKTGIGKQLCGQRCRLSKVGSIY
jgi:hypothetical protein